MEKKIDIVFGDDWEGIYVDNVLIDEGHSLQVGDVLALLGYDVSARECDYEWLYEMGSLPKTLDKVKLCD